MQINATGSGKFTCDPALQLTRMQTAGTMKAYLLRNIR
ncbi:hypothetical protein C5S31_08285 [ANME-1 cluster archaeon GoMg2]|nr:hypothetical protein [ANME-1 cluster archaeon GoMg2]